jgi:hypothetical protein
VERGQEAGKSSIYPDPPLTRNRLIVLCASELRKKYAKPHSIVFPATENFEVRQNRADNQESNAWITVEREKRLIISEFHCTKYNSYQHTVQPLSSYKL